MWINFYGHAGTDAWGNGLTEPEDLVNSENKRYIVTDISCSTVRFAEPLVDAFSEKLLFAQTGGAMAYIGGSGFGYETPLRALATEFYRQVSADSVRELGELLLHAKVVLRNQGTPSTITQEALQQVTLLGDPAMVMALATKPDYAISGSEVKIDPPQPSEADSQVSLGIPVRNFGLMGTDSVDVRITHTVEQETPEVTTLKRPPFGNLDSIVVSQPSFRRGGFHTIAVSVDPANQIPEADESNNASQLTYFVTSGGLEPLLPPPSASLHPDSVTLTVLNPNDPRTAGWEAVFEIDTSAGFASSAKLQHLGPMGASVTTSWSVPQGMLRDSMLYYWRARMQGGADSTGWISGQFLTRSDLPRRWVQDRPAMFSTNAAQGIDLTADPRLLRQNIPVNIYSAGFSDGNEATITLANTIISQGLSNRGYNIAVVNQYTGELESFAAFSIYSDTPDTTLTEPLIQFLNAIPSGRRVLVGIADRAVSRRDHKFAGQAHD